MLNSSDENKTAAENVKTVNIKQPKASTLFHGGPLGPTFITETMNIEIE